MTKKLTRPGLDRTGDNIVEFRRNGFYCHSSHNFICKSLIAMLAIVFAAPAIYAAEQPAEKPIERPDFTLSKLVFEDVEESFEDFANLKISGMTYVARFNFDTNVNLPVTDKWSTRNGRIRKTWGFINGYGGKILNTPTGKKLSPKQKELISTEYGLVHLESNSGISPIYVLGVNKEQAQNTAIAFLECLIGSAEKSYRSVEKTMQDTEKLYQERKELVESFPDKIKIAKEKFEQKKRDTHYQQQEAALKAIERMNVICESKIIEMRVLEAKRQAIMAGLDREDAIKGVTSPDKYNRQTIVLKLEELRIDISIDLAAVEATIQAAEKIRRDAELFLKFEDELEHLEGGKSGAIAMISRTHTKLSELKRIMQRHLPPKVIDNKVILQPVKYVKPQAN